MKEIMDGIMAYEKKDVENKLTKSNAKKIFVYDKEFNAFNYITNVYEDDQGDFIIEIGGDA